MKLKTFTALPTTPKKLGQLLDIASNMWFSWNWDARQLFAKLDDKVWVTAHKNPLRMLCDIPQQRMIEMSNDDGYVAESKAVELSFKKYLGDKGWFEEQYGPRKQLAYAYFCCEFGIHESLPIYSGGLGVLAGDHLKSASDLGLPLVAIGILYRQGYFRQELNADGVQLEFYPENDKYTMPVKLVKDESGKPIVLSMDLAGDEVYYQIWEVPVGRIKLYLLDTNLQSNLPHHRDITEKLYVSDRAMRLKQEILLGIGGYRALKAMNIIPRVFHINEGHSAFLILERIRDYMEESGLSFDEAKEIVWATNVFTTHTPVPAGNERFSVDLLREYLAVFVQQRLGLKWSEFLAMGREEPDRQDEEFCMTVLALKFSCFVNGVARLHGEVSRRMWQKLYPQIPLSEIPIDYITNGVHSKSWLSKNFEQLFARYLQTAYVREIADFTLFKVIDDIPDAELWFSHLERKKGLVKYAREKLKAQLSRRGSSANEISKVKRVLDPNVLTIGFARRFATYKRGALIFEDLARLEKIVNNPEMPVQFIFAGKAHPADTGGKEIIKKIANIAKTPEFFDRIVFLEDYDIDVARYIVQGVDVWLNNPERPKEASGTSGMKAAINGAINLSILDGWWDEAFDGENGWAIGHAEIYDNKQNQNAIEANLLYRLLETEVVPTYYKRDEMNIPVAWMKMMKHSIKTCAPNFNSHRMITDYLRKFYIKAEKMYEKLTENNFERAKNLSAWRKKMSNSWGELQILEVEAPANEVIYAGEEVVVKTRIKLPANIMPSDLIVEVYYGNLDQQEAIIDPRRQQMVLESQEGDTVVFKAMIACRRGGRYGYTTRVLLGNENLADNLVPGFIKWAP